METQPDPTAANGLQGVRVLVIEDEPMICMMFEDMLSELGCEVVGPAYDIEKATELAQHGVDFDIAILDVNLGGQPVFRVADLLVSRKIPFLFSTGMGAGGLPLEWRDHSTIPKPMTMADLENGLTRVLCKPRGE
jgi:CheY-like chemotaxis protein